MKTFTDIPIHQFGQVITNTVNKNSEKYLGEFNGRLDGQNMPVASITDDNLREPQIPINFTPQSGPVSIIGSQCPTQSYFRTARRGWEEGSSDIWTPLLTIDLDTDDWTRGFNSLQQWSGWSTFPLSFQSKEGMLIGCATIDWQHACQTYNVAGSGGGAFFAYNRGNEWWTEWGVFVNNVLVARTGQIMPRRHTTQIPFSIPVGSQNITVDVRFITNTWHVDGAPLAPDHSSTAMHIFSAEIWCRNNFR